MNQRSAGFSLVEIAVVLVIIGLLLGGILKGQEMINSAKVRSLADLNAGASAAYYGFIDRYRRVPGDWTAAAATDALGLTVSGGGNDNGRIDNEPGTEYTEPNALWEHISKAGFVDGAYTGLPGKPDTNSNQTPLNPFNHNVLIGRTGDYIDQGASPVRLNAMLGRGIPVDVARELDIKIDNGVPNTGVLRLAVDIGAGAVFGELGESDPLCQDAGPPVTYNVSADSQDCNVVFLY